MGKARHNISNWRQYNRALINRGSLTFWVDEQAIEQWYCGEHHGRRGRGFQYSDSAIETALMLKAFFGLPFRALEGFINSIFQLMNVPLTSPSYSNICKWAQTVEINYRLPSKGAVTHLVIDATGLKVFGEGEWKQRKHGKSQRRIWRKLHLAVDARTHEVIAAEVSLESVADSEVLPTLLNPLRRRIHQVSADGAYDTQDCHQLLLRKGITERQCDRALPNRVHHTRGAIQDRRPGRTHHPHADRLTQHRTPPLSIRHLPHPVRKRVLRSPQAPN